MHHIRYFHVDVALDAAYRINPKRERISDHMAESQPNFLHFYFRELSVIHMSRIFLHGKIGTFQKAYIYDLNKGV